MNGLLGRETDFKLTGTYIDIVKALVASQDLKLNVIGTTILPIELAFSRQLNQTIYDMQLQVTTEFHMNEPRTLISCCYSQATEKMRSCFTSLKRIQLSKRSSSRARSDTWLSFTVSSPTGRVKLMATKALWTFTSTSTTSNY